MGWSTTEQIKGLPIKEVFMQRQKHYHEIAENAGRGNLSDSKMKVIEIIKTLSEKKVELLLDFIDRLEKTNT